MKSADTVYPLNAIRALALHIQGLTAPLSRRPRPGIEDVYSAIERVAWVQIDTLQVVQRAQYLTLWSRLGAYDTADFDRLLCTCRRSRAPLSAGRRSAWPCDAASSGLRSSSKENTRGYFLLMRGLIQRFGIPIALYTDRHSVFKNVPGAGRAGAPTQFSRAMDELGVQMVFALSPQAKGRVERTAGTFQDRLVTELRLAGATTIEEANVVLKEFPGRFNERFGVAAQHPEAACRPLGPGVCLDRVLCFRHSRRVARDNTVKYRWRTLQLLPGAERRSYAGAVVDVLEDLDGQLAVRYRGEIIASQEAPSRPGILRSFNGSSSHKSGPRPDLNGLDRRWEAVLAALDAEMDARDADGNGAVRVRKAPAMQRRKPTPLQTARWNAVQKAKRRGLSISLNPPKEWGLKVC